MNGGGESSSGIVPTKQPNEDLGRSKEAVEGRPLAEENAASPTHTGHRAGNIEISGQTVCKSKVGTVCVSSASTGSVRGVLGNRHPYRDQPPF